MGTAAAPIPEVVVGDAGAGTDFADFFRATWARLFRTTYAVAGDRSSAEDALQSAYAKAYASWTRISRVDHPEAYVRRMAINEVLGARRRAWWRSERTGPLVGAAEPPAQPSPEARTTERDAVWQVVSALPPKQRAVIVLRYYEDLSEAEIAAVLGCSRGTVKSQASDALRRLRQLQEDTTHPLDDRPGGQP